MLFVLSPSYFFSSLSFCEQQVGGRGKGEGSKRAQSAQRYGKAWWGRGSFFIFLSLLLKGGKMEEGLTVPNSLSLSHFASDTKSQREKKASK